MASSTCPRCGAGYDPREANFCQSCGQAFHGTVEERAQTTPAHQPPVVVYVEQTRRGSALARTIVVLAVVIAVFYLISNIELTATVNGVMTITPLGTATP